MSGPGDEPLGDLIGWIHRYSTELLGRAEVCPSPLPTPEWLRNQSVLVTGAGGSVGPWLSAELLRAQPASLTLLDHHENSLWELYRRFGDQGERVQLILADVRDRRRLGEVFASSRPNTVFHLAAYKHVPFGEQFSGETFAVNVLGTQNILELAEQVGTERVVYPSSDKACDPPSLYGATKRLSELLVRSFARRTGNRFNIARFVNILGTQGSVIETFVQQIRAGQPLTVTDRRMTRYWISMSEAVWLLMSAAALPTGGETIMVDAPEEVSVAVIAERVWQLLRGDEPMPSIQFGSPRPGERLREILRTEHEQVERGPCQGLVRMVDSQSEEHLRAIESILEQLVVLSESGGSLALRAAAMSAARQLQ